jgi:hypothetical protein
MASDASPQVSRDRNLAWFDEKVPALDPKTRELLEHYAGIPPDQVERRLVEFVRPDLELFTIPRSH